MAWLGGYDWGVSVIFQDTGGSIDKSIIRRAMCAGYGDGQVLGLLSRRCVNNYLSLLQVWVVLYHFVMSEDFTCC